MKRFLAVIALACLLSVPSLAGEIPTVGAPQPTQASSNENKNSPGDIPTGGFTGDIATDGLSVVLSVIRFLV